MDKHQAFLKAYADHPSQDNEGHVPDRGAYKAGFYAAWEIQEERIRLIQASLKRIRDMLEKTSVR